MSFPVWSGLRLRFPGKRSDLRQLPSVGRAIKIFVSGAARGVAGGDSSPAPLYRVIQGWASRHFGHCLLTRGPAVTSELPLWLWLALLGQVGSDGIVAWTALLMVTVACLLVLVADTRPAGCINTDGSSQIIICGTKYQEIRTNGYKSQRMWMASVIRWGWRGAGITLHTSHLAPRRKLSSRRPNPNFPPLLLTYCSEGKTNGN